MTINLAINGYGRIGRMILRALYESKRIAELRVVAITEGVRKVLLSAPGSEKVDATIVYGINDDVLSSKHEIVSNASSTTNCLAPLVPPLHEAIGLMTKRARNLVIGTKHPFCYA